METIESMLKGPTVAKFLTFVEGIGVLQPKYESLVPALVPLGAVGVHFFSVNEEPYATHNQIEQLHQHRLWHEVFAAPPP